ncbi:hypothetical protein J0S82_013949 [Galemys pyrenaicus]|uniref:Uncharacterized protein n=1 Tax=Galemys pyrenaicus TaxID=202257 RepID=A0A8J6AI57_GALPY|nr:hypothetical protein J0S82_013949 [Galemys pyrenaicus]
MPVPTNASGSRANKQREYQREQQDQPAAVAKQPRGALGQADNCHCFSKGSCHIGSSRKEPVLCCVQDSGFTTCHIVVLKRTAGKCLNGKQTSKLVSIQERVKVEKQASAIKGSLAILGPTLIHPPPSASSWEITNLSEAENPHSTLRKLHRLQMEIAMTQTSRHVCLRMLGDVLSLGPHSSGVLMTLPIYARVQHRCAHLRMPTLECSQHHSLEKSVVVRQDPCAAGSKRAICPLPLEDPGGGLDLLHRGLSLCVEQAEKLTQNRAVLKPVMDISMHRLKPGHVLVPLGGLPHSRSPYRPRNGFEVLSHFPSGRWPSPQAGGKATLDVTGRNCS